MATRSGLFQAILDAIFGEDDRLGGVSITKLTAPLSETETTVMAVESTLRFGENHDGTNDALLLIEGEVISANSRAITFDSFGGLTRGIGPSTVKAHPQGALVYDFSKNRSALDLVRRGLFVRTARLEDLDVIGRNLGLHKCPGLDEETWRSLIEVMAYLPDQPVDAFRKVLDVYPGVGNYEIIEETVTQPNVVTILVTLLASGSSLRGKFFLNGGYNDVIDGGGTTVTLPFTPNEVRGVYRRNDLVDRGERTGQTNLFASFVGPVITLTADPAPDLLAGNVMPGDPTIRPVTPSAFPLSGPFSVRLVDGPTNEIVNIIGQQTLPFPALIVDPATPVLNTYFAGPGTVQLVHAPGDEVVVDAGGFTAHYLAQDESIRYPADGDYFPYLSDVSAIVQCLLDQIAAAGVRVIVTTAP